MIVHIRTNVVLQLVLLLSSDAGTGGGGKYLADQLTLFQPGRRDYPHLLLLAPPIFFTFRHHCYYYYYDEGLHSKLALSHLTSSHSHYSSSSPAVASYTAHCTDDTVRTNGQEDRQTNCFGTANQPLHVMTTDKHVLSPLPPHFVLKWGFMRTFPENQDATLK